jgi:Mg2+-importing ATPase
VALAAVSVAIVAIVGAVLPATPLAHTLGFSPLPAACFGALVAMVIEYLVLIEFGKRIFYRASASQPGPRRADNQHTEVFGRNS